MKVGENGQLNVTSYSHLVIWPEALERMEMME